MSSLSLSYQKARLEHSEFTETQKRRFEEEKAELNEPLIKLSKEMNKIKKKILKEQVSAFNDH